MKWEFGFDLYNLWKIKMFNHKTLFPFPLKGPRFTRTFLSSEHLWFTDLSYNYSENTIINGISLKQLREWNKEPMKQQKSVST